MLWTMKMTDAYIRRHTQKDIGQDSRSQSGKRRNRYKIVRRRNAIVICALALLLMSAGINSRIKQHKAEQEKLYWEEYYASRKYEPVTIDSYVKEEKKPYDPQADPLSPYFTAPAYRTGSKNPGNTRKNYTPYKRGYWDGYDEGYDDRVQGMGYGYKYDCSGESYEYQQGFAKGYKDGFTEGWEDSEAFGD